MQTGSREGDQIMKSWHKFLSIPLLLLSTASLFAGGGAGYPLDKVHNDLKDEASLQRGAQTYMNYCGGCHSLQYMRYNGMAKGIGIVDRESGQVLEKLAHKNLNFTSDKVTDNILTAMPKADAESWFGVAPPDLSLITSYRGKDWLYSYMHGFYLDSDRPWGVNNAVFPDVGMPHILVGLQGTQIPVYSEENEKNGGEKHIIGLKLEKEGILSPKEYDTLVTDLVNFLEYVGEPHKTEREHLGVWVMLFLVLFTLLAYLLKREYWKDVH
jgi:ubiquinol-cytochrome c reductase cytochrome c1 subunit